MTPTRTSTVDRGQCAFCTSPGCDRKYLKPGDADFSLYRWADWPDDQVYCAKCFDTEFAMYKLAKLAGA